MHQKKIKTPRATVCLLPATNLHTPGVVPELFSSTKLDTGSVGPGWRTWTSTRPAPSPSPGPPPFTGFSQTLNLATGIVTVKTNHVTVHVAVDLNAPMRNGVAHRDAGILWINATTTNTERSSSSGGGGGGGGTFSLVASLEPYRVEGAVTKLGRGFCRPRFDHADTVVAGSDAVTWYHWNHINDTYYNDTISNQGVSPDTPGLVDPFHHLAWGGSLSGEGFAKPPDSSDLALSITGASTASLQLKLLTLKVDDPVEWLSEIPKIAPAPPGTPFPPGETETPTSWAEINERSYIQITGYIE